MKATIICSLAGTLLCQQLAAQDSAAIKAINAESFTSHIKILASDAFEGRKPFTRGEDSTIQYMAAQFKQLGLKPGNGNSYFQDVPMVSIGSKPAGNLVVKGATGEVSLQYLDDFVAATRRVQEQVSIKNSELVFAGYGIVAPEYNWNDYAGLDVKGKTVIVLINDPGFADSTLFKGRTMSYYGRWTYKFEEASRRGATGIIIIHETAAASYPWKVVRSGWSNSKLHLQTPDNNMHRTALEGWITLDAAGKIFQLAGVSPDIMEKARVKGFKPVDLHLQTSLVINNTIKKSTSHNVLAILPGATRPQECIVYSAHWDHFGIGEPVKGDSIYNGAVDNATGTAGLLELATAFTKLPQKPARSLLFLSVTGEEQGLLGSEYYAAHPTFAIEKIVADINLDVLNTFGRTKDITVIGYGQSELDEYAQRAAARQGRIIAREANPEGGWFFRSDHFNFAKKGVPGLYIGPGTDAIGHEAGWGKEQIATYNRLRYHSPADEFDPATWVMDGMVEDIRLLFDVGYHLSNESSFPKWKAGSEFKAYRK
ncbi:Zn-dependent M28 family amino/carboxypeptidase [Chitinophaga niastensis]|uniref:Zn-dependent M28 family amino/carboxypeptidase n=1 Tax=Chitinophaga niastensis TaxID=536980 RepID=A0A2P8HF70_CHINA|nr:M28 family metallopeptidase [Chitinophaga niastensis]PSL44869.1 Zn-dependent M28 family amino/carboxypeptidase [Chitinophaga niastensis]